MSRVGQKICKIRNDKGLSQKQLAKKLGVSEKFIKEVEIGKRIINESLIDKISKILGKEINDISMNYDEKEEKIEKKIVGIESNKVNDVWNDAFESVLKTIPIYEYDLNNVIGTRQMPVISSKIEGLSSDKVIFLKIEDDDMLGFRISKGDIAFAYITHEIINNSICLVEYNSNICVRQVKKLDTDKMLLISNKVSLKAETVSKKNLRVLARLIRVEINLI